MQVQIIPKYVNPPKPGGKMGSIKDQEGGFYLVSPAYLSNFQIGQPVNIEYGEKMGQQGPIRFINSINGLRITGQQGPVQAGDRPAPTPQNVPQSDKEEGMFIMGVVGRAMGSGKFEAHEVPVLTKWAAEAWKHRHTPFRMEQNHGLDNNPITGEQAMHGGPDPDDDEIPF